MESFAQLVIDAQQGDRAAFGELVQRFQDMAVGYAYTILHDWHLAEDAAQEAFVEAYRTLCQLREPLAFPAWLRRILFKQCDRLTRRKQVTTVALTAASTTASAEHPVQHVEAAEMRTQLLGAIQSLPTEEHAVLTLFYLSSYSHKEIAAFLEMPLTTVNNRLRSARRRLQERMMKMVEENLQGQRPSRSAEFAERVLRFVNAADSGYVDTVETMLAEYPDLVDASGRARYSTRNVRALHYALNYGHADVVAQLLAAGADINAKAGETWAPIHYAIRGAHPELAQMRVDRGADVDIYAAAGLGDLAKVRAFVNDRPRMVHQRGPGGATALHFAATEPVARFLLQEGADVNAQDDRGRTPLTWCAEIPEVVALLRANGAESDDIFLACAVGDRQQVANLIDADRALLHMRKDPRTGTPLHVAADKGQIEIARLLIERGAAVNAATDSGAVTPLHDAAFSGHLEMVRFLLAHGADPSACDAGHNATPAAWARFNGHDKVAAVLEEAASQ